MYDTLPAFKDDCTLTEERMPGDLELGKVPEYLLTYFCSEDPLLPAEETYQN